MSDYVLGAWVFNEPHFVKVINVTLNVMNGLI